MTPHVLGKNVVGSFNDALLVSNPTSGGIERVDMASLAGASWNAGYDPADADCIVNTSALVAAYKAQATASQDARYSRPTAGMSYSAADLYDLSLLARQVVDYQDQIERLQVSSRSITEQRISGGFGLSRPKHESRLQPDRVCRLRKKAAISP